MARLGNRCAFLFPSFSWLNVPQFFAFHRLKDPQKDESFRATKVLCSCSTQVGFEMNTNISNATAANLFNSLRAGLAFALKKV